MQNGNGQTQGTTGGAGGSVTDQVRQLTPQLLALAGQMPDFVPAAVHSGEWQDHSWGKDPWDKWQNWDKWANS